MNLLVVVVAVLLGRLVVGVAVNVQHLMPGRHPGNQGDQLPQLRLRLLPDLVVGIAEQRGETLPPLARLTAASLRVVRRQDQCRTVQFALRLVLGAVPERLRNIRATPSLTLPQASVPAACTTAVPPAAASASNASVSIPTPFPRTPNSSSRPPRLDSPANEVPQHRHSRSRHSDETVPRGDTCIGKEPGERHRRQERHGQGRHARPHHPRGRRPVVAALMLGMALAAIDGTIVSTAVPQIVGDLGGLAVFSWLFSGYLLAVTVTLPLYGKLSDTFGRKPVLIARDHPVPGRLGPLRGRVEHGRAHRVPYRPGAGRRCAPGHGADHRGRPLPAEGTPADPGEAVHGVGHVGGGGAGRRRAARRVRRLAVDLPDQPPGRGRRPLARRPPSPRALPAPARRPAPGRLGGRARRLRDRQPAAHGARAGRWPGPGSRRRHSACSGRARCWPR